MTLTCWCNSLASHDPLAESLTRCNKAGNKFVDCAIAVDADFIMTSDRHFDALHSSGYKPKPIDPAQFIAKYF